MIHPPCAARRDLSLSFFRRAVKSLRLASISALTSLATSSRTSDFDSS